MDAEYAATQKQHLKELQRLMHTSTYLQCFNIILRPKDTYKYSQGAKIHTSTSLQCYKIRTISYVIFKIFSCFFLIEDFHL
jgi:hypothetical protein